MQFFSQSFFISVVAHPTAYPAKAKILIHKLHHAPHSISYLFSGVSHLSHQLLLCLWVSGHLDRPQFPCPQCHTKGCCSCLEVSPFPAPAKPAAHTAAAYPATNASLNISNISAPSQTNLNVLVVFLLLVGIQNLGTGMPWTSKNWGNEWGFWRVAERGYIYLVSQLFDSLRK